MKYGMRKNGLKLEPVDDISVDMLSQYKDGDYILITPSTTRSVKFHSRYWAIQKFILDNLPERFSSLRSTEDVHYISKYLATKQGYTGSGHFIPSKNGELFIPKKTDFSSMSQEEFSIYFDFAMLGWKNTLGWDVEEAFEINQFNI
jgi:hypothetical protein